jgi:transposase
VLETRHIGLLDGYQVECFFHWLRRFRAIATRYEKMARNFFVVQFVCWLTLA